MRTINKKIKKTKKDNPIHYLENNSLLELAYCMHTRYIFDTLFVVTIFIVFVCVIFNIKDGVYNIYSKFNGDCLLNLVTTYKTDGCFNK